MAEYLHCSFAGSYWVECEILEKVGDKIKIRYFEPIMLETVDEIVEKCRIKE